MEKNMPKYIILLEWIKQQIAEGKLSLGDRLYSENMLCDMFKISRQTVRQALGLLESEGLVERRRGSGTYISAQPRRVAERTMTIGVISTYSDDYIFPSIIRGIESVVSKRDYSMQLSFTHNRVENEMQALRNMIDKQVDGIIVEPTKSGLPNPNMHLYEEIVRLGIPAIFFNAYYAGLAIPHVSLDDRATGRAATEYLLERGHTNIAGFFQCDDLQGHLRYAGYLDALIGAGIRINAERVLWFSTEDKPLLFYEEERLLSRLRDCTAVVCYNDEIAAQCMVFLSRQGLRIPEDVSVIGVDNSNLADYCEPPLTSIEHPKANLGRTAAKNLIRLIENPEFDATVEFPAQIVERQSVVPPAGRFRGENIG